MWFFTGCATALGGEDFLELVIWVKMALLRIIVSASSFSDFSEKDFSIDS